MTANPPNAGLLVRNIYKEYLNQPLLAGITFVVSPGETVCLLGASGSGKSTILRIIAGLETPDEGEIYWNGQNLASVPVHKRNFSLMFQDYALFPHKSVYENVAFGLRMHHVAAGEIPKIVAESLERVRMAEFSKRPVLDLSGGEQQRVALARALAVDPALLMLDEPLSSLDKTLRSELLQFLRHLLRESNVPAVYVTHDQEEAFALADRVILLRDGRIEQEGAPQELYQHPKNRWVASFFGLGNQVSGRLESNGAVRTDIGQFTPAEACTGHSTGDPVHLLLSPVGARPVERGEVVNCVSGVVTDSAFRGEDYAITLSCVNRINLQFFIPESLNVGSQVTLRLDSQSIQCID